MREIVMIVQAAVNTAVNWSGRSKATDRKVLRAHIQLACKLGSLTYHASVRTVADKAGIPARTVADAHKRLVKLGWLHVVCPTDSHDANVWTWLPAWPTKSTRHGGGVTGGH